MRTTSFITPDIMRWPRLQVEYWLTPDKFAYSVRYELLRTMMVINVSIKYTSVLTLIIPRSCTVIYIIPAANQLLYTIYVEIIFTCTASLTMVQIYNVYAFSCIKLSNQIIEQLIYQLTIILLGEHNLLRWHSLGVHSHVD
jgi:hypothetical protein